MALTASQQARLDSANNAYKLAIDAYNSQKGKCELTAKFLADSRQKALDCQAARDGKSTGIGKNQACHINTLTSLNQVWNMADADNKDCQAKLAAANTRVVDAKKALDAVTEAIRVEVEAAIKALETDPVYKAAKEQRDADIAAQKTKSTLIFIVILVAVVIAGVVIYRMNK